MDFNFPPEQGAHRFLLQRLFQRPSSSSWQIWDLPRFSAISTKDSYDYYKYMTKSWSNVEWKLSSAFNWTKKIALAKAIKFNLANFLDLSINRNGKKREFAKWYRSIKRTYLNISIFDWMLRRVQFLLKRQASYPMGPIGHEKDGELKLSNVFSWKSKKIVSLSKKYEPDSSRDSK